MQAMMRNTQDSTGAEQPTNLRDAAPAASEQLDQGWVASLLRPLLVVVMVSSIDLVLLTFLRQYAPGMTPAVRWSIVGMGVLAAIIGCATTTWLAQPAQDSAHSHGVTGRGDLGARLALQRHC